MKLPALLCSAMLLTGPAAMAADAASKPAANPAPTKLVLVDLSVEAVMDGATAKAMMAQAITPTVIKLYPVRKWGWASQVEGGHTPDETCVITARVMMAPLTVTKGLILRPEAGATAFGAIPKASREQCRQLAKDKLKEALDSMISGLVKTS
jgi:hypothetical protein